MLINRRHFSNYLFNFYKSPSNDVSTEILNETLVSSNLNTTIGSLGEHEALKTVGGSSGGLERLFPHMNKQPRKYVHTRLMSKMRDEINAVEHFKTRADDHKTINALMERALAVGLNSHLKRRKAELKKQTSYEPKSIEDLSPFGDHGSKVTLVRIYSFIKLKINQQKNHNKRYRDVSRHLRSMLRSPRRFHLN